MENFPVGTGRNFGLIQNTLNFQENKIAGSARKLLDGSMFLVFLSVKYASVLLHASVLQHMRFLHVLEAIHLCYICTKFLLL